ncbi:MAG: CoA-binding protein [Bacteroidia bacterium]|nr:CoA-binding protein [Bacteroidia bacterium]MCZ2277323.1 CoA-binding protein [Bacteroidia bacterium]
MKKKTLVLGASVKPERYSFKAINRLRDAGLEVVAVGNRKGSVRDVEILTNTKGIEGIHTVTLYLNPLNQEPYKTFIYELAPQRVIFNPGTENPGFETELEEKGIETIEACTLVMLSTGQF